MREIQVSERHFRFLEDFLTESSRKYFKISLDANTLQLRTENDNLAYLLEAFQRGEATILPYLGNEDELFLIDTQSRRFERISVLLERFLVPSYAEYLQASQYFDKDSEIIFHCLGAELFPAGFSRFRIFRKDLTTIMERLRRMLEMQSHDAPILSNPARNYRELYQQFQTALAAEAWKLAERSLSELQQESLISAENLEFLHIQLLAQQSRWKEIYSLPKYSDLTRLKVMPRLVRAALLTAFHVKHLLPLENEGKFDTAYEYYRLERGNLGHLLTGRYGLKQDAVLRIFAYEAIQAGDRAVFEMIEAEAENPDTQQILRTLAKRLPPPTMQASTPLEAAKIAMALRQFDKAFDFAESVETGVEKTYLLLELVFQSQDKAIAEAAEDAYTSLNQADTTELLRQAHVENSYLPLLAQILNPPSQPESPILSNILLWSEYFQSNSLDRPYARECLDRLMETQDDPRFTVADLRKLSAILSQFLEKEQAKDSLLSDALLYLSNHLMTDEAFPRSQEPYPRLYEQIFKAASQRSYNDVHSHILLRLADAVLQNSPDNLDLVALELMDWFAKPLPALEETLLAAFELLAEYGIRGADLSDLYQVWLEALNESPKIRPRTFLESWMRLANWVHAPQYLRDMLTTALETIPVSVTDPIASLPAEYKLVIYSLRQDSADMARQRLLERNAKLDIEICTDKVATERARALATKADLAVVVTHSLKHALYNAIWPMVEEKAVRPVSSGTTSILRSIEERLLL
jgi:hypothetical protein